MIKIRFRISLLIITGILNVLVSNAQKLPGTQEKSVLLPATTNIDGLATEWNNNFQAYNKSTDIYYTLANDKDNLYLAIQATDPVIMKKVIGGGVTLTLCASGDKNDTNPLYITIPAVAASLQIGINNAVNELTDSKTNKDSLLNALNKQIAIASKKIEVRGFKGFNDSLVAVTNNTALKMAVQVNEKNALTYELMIPLRLTGITGNQQIAYNIKVNNVASIAKYTHSDGVSVSTIPHGLAVNQADIQAMMYNTDFWGKYTLNN